MVGSLAALSDSVSVLCCLVYEKAESRVKMPKGPAGRNFLAQNHPELVVALKLLPKPN